MLGGVAFIHSLIIFMGPIRWSTHQGLHSLSRPSLVIRHS